MMEKFIDRWLTTSLYDALAASPAVFINGPRQAGKSTLVKQLINKPIKASYITFDDLSVRAAAESDPLAFLRQFKGSVIIDEVQLVPSMFRVIKLIIDELRQEGHNKANGRFILTGSANVLALPELSDALVGRVRILTLLPLSMGEYNKRQAALQNFFYDLQSFSSNNTFEEFLLDRWVYHATFPEIAILADKQKKCEGWYRDYLTTILQRDVRQLAEIDKVSALPNLLRILALRAASLINDAATARDVGLNTMTYRRYRILLQNVFLVATLSPWFRNVGKRLLKTPKLFFYDTGLLVTLLDLSLDQLKKSQSPLYGHLVENFVACELMKQLTIVSNLQLFHYRTEDGKEVDFVIQGSTSKLIGVEVKAKSVVTENDFTGLKSLKELAGKDFKHGIVLYTGKQVLAFASDMIAIPITALML